MYKIQLALLFIILCHGCAQSKLHAPTVTDLVDQYTYCDIRSYKDISYNNVYTLDVHCKDQLDTLRRPVILFIHGGGWNSGSKEVWRTPQIEFFAYMGFITVALNYPLSPYPIDTLRPNGILHPRHITSIAKAFRWIYDHIEEYGGDHNQINIIGHSSGAHLALLLATNQRFLQQESLDLPIIHRVYCSDSGPYMTLDSCMSPDSPDEYLRSLFLCWVNAMGRDRAKWEDAVPLFHIEPNKNIPPIMLGHSTVPYRVQANAKIYQALIENGYDAEYFVMPGAEHGKMIPSIGTDDDIYGIGRKIVLFFRNTKN